MSERLDCDVDWVRAQPVEAATIIDTQRDEIERLRAAADAAFFAMCAERDSPDAEVFHDAIDALGVALSK